MKNSMLKFSIFVGLLSCMPTVFALDSQEERLNSSKEKAINILAKAGFKKQFDALTKLYSDAYNARFFDEKIKTLYEQSDDAMLKLCFKREEPAIKKQQNEVTKLFVQSQKLYDDASQKLPEYKQLLVVQKEFSKPHSDDETRKLGVQLDNLIKQIDAQIPEVVQQNIKQLQDQGVQASGQINALMPEEINNAQAASDAYWAYLSEKRWPTGPTDNKTRESFQHQQVLLDKKRTQLKNQLQQEVRTLGKLFLEKSKSQAQGFLTVVGDILKTNRCFLVNNQKDSELQILSNIFHALIRLQQER